MDQAVRALKQRPSWCVINLPLRHPSVCTVTQCGVKTDLSEVLELSMNIDGPRWHTCSSGRWTAAVTPTNPDDLITN